MSRGMSKLSLGLVKNLVNVGQVPYSNLLEGVVPSPTFPESTGIEPSGVSQDGLTVVGNIYNVSTGNPEGFILNVASGDTTVLHQQFPVGTDAVVVSGITKNGQVVYGRYNDTSTNFQYAFSYSNGVTRCFPPPTDVPLVEDSWINYVSETGIMMFAEYYEDDNGDDVSFLIVNGVADYTMSQFPPGTVSFYTSGISADRTTIVGICTNSIDDTIFIYKESTGFVFVSSAIFPAGAVPYVTSVSVSGSSIGGGYRLGAAYTQFIMDTNFPTSIVDVSAYFTPGSSSRDIRCLDDTGTAFSGSEWSGTPIAFIVTLAAGRIEMSSFSNVPYFWVNAVSADGSTWIGRIPGSVLSGSPGDFVITTPSNEVLPTGGVYGTDMPMNGAFFPYTFPYEVDALSTIDGYVYGAIEDPTGVRGYVPYRWVEAANGNPGFFEPLPSLPVLPGYSEGYINLVSADRNTIVGTRFGSPYSAMNIQNLSTGSVKTYR